MHIILSRSQKTAIGQLQADVVYTFDENDPGHQKVIENLLRDGGFGKKMSKAAIKARGKKAEEIAVSREAETRKIEALAARDDLAEAFSELERTASDNAARAAKSEAENAELKLKISQLEVDLEAAKSAAAGDADK